ncbi:MAG: hypothetical protein EG825_11365 [Rhodocyclaceae bacterium]|nr:hypothetical protein [Rhodocyclaceae bacterium]
MTKPGQRRIMIQVWTPLLKAIKRDFKALHIGFDAYLNELLTQEIEHLENEVTFRNSDEVRKRIESRPILDKKKITPTLDEGLIAHMNEVLTRTNIPRESFFHRVLFFLVAREEHLHILKIDYDKRSDNSAKPLDDAWGFLHDPFFPIRSRNDNCFYTIPCFPDKPIDRSGVNLFSFNTAISDEYWKLMNSELEDLFVTLGLESPNSQNQGISN